MRMRQGPPSDRSYPVMQELDEACEELLEEEFEETTNFEVSDALQKLEKLSIVNRVRKSRALLNPFQESLSGRSWVYGTSLICLELLGELNPFAAKQLCNCGSPSRGTYREGWMCKHHTRHVLDWVCLAMLEAARKALFLMRESELCSELLSPGFVGPLHAPILEESERDHRFDDGRACRDEHEPQGSWVLSAEHIFVELALSEHTDQTNQV